MRLWLVTRRRVRSIDGRANDLIDAARAVVPSLVPFGLPAAAVGVTGLVGGGYFSSSWGWLALGPLLALAAGLIGTAALPVDRLGLLFIGSLALFLCWKAASAAWSDSLPLTVDEVERDLIYPAAAAALLVLARRASLVQIARGLVAGAIIVAGDALLTGRAATVATIGSEQLVGRIGYWNALGLVSAIGTVLATGLTGASTTRAQRGVTAGSAVVLVLALYFTFSRGAWFALVAGLGAALALSCDRRRLAVSILATTPFCVLAIWIVSTAEADLTGGGLIELARTDTERFVGLMATVAATSFVVPFTLERTEGKGASAARRRRVVTTAVVAIAVAAASASLAGVGGPARAFERTIDTFRSPPADGTGHSRIFSLSGRGRSEYWSVAWAQFRSHSISGSGAGTFEIYWNRDRPTPFGARDAHNLYLETLAELGPLGLLLVLGIVGAPVLAFPVARRDVLGASAAGGHTAFGLHAALDWDWELPAVTLLGLSCGVVVLLVARTRAFEVPVRPGARAAALAAIALLATFALVGQRGNSAFAEGTEAAAAGRYAEAAAKARAAAAWAPWSGDAWRLLGEAQLATGRKREARESFLTAIEKDPRRWRNWYGLALASAGDERRRALARAARLNPLAPEITSLQAEP